MFKSIDGLMQMTHMARMLGINLYLRLSHIDLFLESAMEKGILNTQLTKRSVE